MVLFTTDRGSGGYDMVYFDGADEWVIVNDLFEKACLSVKGFAIK